MNPGVIVYRLIVICLWAVTVVGCGGVTPPPPTAKVLNPAENAKNEAAERYEREYEGWKKYAPTDGGFEVRFPQEPTVKPASPSSGGFHFAGVPASSPGGLGFTCQWTVKKESFSDMSAEAAYLKGQQSGAVRTSRGKLVDESDLSQGGQVGRAFIIQMPDKSHGHFRSWVAGTRAVTLQVSGRDLETVRSAEAVKFLSSLRFPD